MSSVKKHYIIRVGDGINFKNSKFPFWGIKSGNNNQFKSRVAKFKKGDILWFMVNKSDGARLIAMAEYEKFFDRREEPLIYIHTITNRQQNWTEPNIGEEDWSIQIHYTNLYLIEKHNIKASWPGGAFIFDYETKKDNVSHDLYSCYEMYVARPKPF